MSTDAFATEKAIIKRGQALLSASSDNVDFRQEYAELLRQYSKLFKMSRLVMRTSDRSQRQLKEAEEALAIANRRMEKELNVGQEIQMAMLPRSFPPFPDHDTFSILASLVPAREVGGDFYDFYMLDHNRLCFCIGDVSGKGVPSALFMAVTQTLLKSAASIENSTAAIMAHVNQELSRDNDACMFVTIFTGILDLSTGELLYTNAGHNPPALRHTDGTIVLLDQRHGPAVGVMEGLEYREDTVTLSSGDMIFLFTDGVTEAMNPDKKLFGNDMLMDVAATECFSTPETAVGAVFEAVMDFEAGAEQSDDITLLALKYTGGPDYGLFKMHVRPRLQEISRVNSEFNTFARSHGIPVDIARKINLVFDELMNNIITYGNCENNDIGITAHVADRNLTVSIAYEGPEFDPCKVPAPDTNLMLDERAEGGLGIFLVKSLMDEFIYRRAGSRNITTVRKLSCCTAQPEQHPLS